MKLSGVFAVATVALCITATNVTAAEMPRAGGLSLPLSSPQALAIPGGLVSKAKPQARIQLAGRRRFRRRRRHGGAIAGAIALGVLGAIAASEAARANDRRAHRHARSCRKWLRKCDRGSDWACDKFDDNC